MQKKHLDGQSVRFKFRGQYYIPKRRLRIRGKLFLIVEEWKTRYKAFDVSMQEWRSIRIRSSNTSHEMKLIQFARMRNRSVPNVYEFYKDGQNEYLVQEWVDGHDLRHYLHRKSGGKPYFQAERSYYLIQGLVAGLNKLHERGIFHGDVKPDNLIVADTKRLVMIDFGTAWSGARTNSRPDEKTRCYAPPEQWLGEKLVDHRCDQFSTSVVLYEMLTGELPYDGRGGFGFDYSHHPQLIPPSKKNKEVWKSLDQVIMRGLSLDKDQRYKTSAVWRQEFNAAIPPGPTKSSQFTQYLLDSALWQKLTAMIKKKSTN